MKQLLKNIELIIKSGGKPEEKVSGIIYEIAGGDENKFDKIISVLEGETRNN